MMGFAIRFLGGTRYFYILQSIRTGRGAFPVSFQSTVRVLEHETDHMPPHTAMVSNVGSCTAISPCVFVAWHLIKCGSNSTFAIKIFTLLEVICDLTGK